MSRASGTVLMACFAVSCAASPRPEPRQEPPARELVVSLERIALRASAEQEAGGATDLDAFVAQEWRGRALASRGAIDRIQAAFGPAAEALLGRVATDLAIEWPGERVIVDVVTTSDASDRPIPPRLAARGRCFAHGRGDDERVQNARIMDCTIAYATRALASRSAIGVELGKKLPPEQAARAWELLVVHVSAATVHAWEPRHEPVLRLSARAVEPDVLAWLDDNWRSGTNPASFAARYAAALQDAWGRGRTDP